MQPCPKLCYTMIRNSINSVIMYSECWPAWGLTRLRVFRYVKNCSMMKWMLHITFKNITLTAQTETWESTRCSFEMAWILWPSMKLCISDWFDVSFAKVASSVPVGHWDRQSKRSRLTANLKHWGEIQKYNWEQTGKAQTRKLREDTRSTRTKYTDR